MSDPKLSKEEIQILKDLGGRIQINSYTQA